MNSKHLNKTKEVSILFTRYNDKLSQFVYYATRKGPTHVSISLDNDETFWSFNTKGFRKEFPVRYKKRIKEFSLYKIRVTDEQHKKLQEIIDEFYKKSENLKYNYIGAIICCAIGLSFVLKNRWFCSQFVGMILTLVGVISLKKSYSRYSPKGIKKEIEKQCIFRKVENPTFLA